MPWADIKFCFRWCRQRNWVWGWVGDQSTVDLAPLWIWLFSCVWFPWWLCPAHSIPWEFSHSEAWFLKTYSGHSIRDIYVITASRRKWCTYQLALLDPSSSQSFARTTMAYSTWVVSMTIYVSSCQAIPYADCCPASTAMAYLPSTLQLCHATLTLRLNRRISTSNSLLSGNALSMCLVISGTFQIVFIVALLSSFWLWS